MTIRECAFCAGLFSGRDGQRFCSRSCAARGVAEARRFLNDSPGVAAAGRRIIRSERGARCERCEFDAEPKILQVHHRDRDRSNNTRENLELLCPNCHALDHLRDRKAPYMRNFAPSKPLTTSAQDDAAALALEAA